MSDAGLLVAVGAASLLAIVAWVAGLSLATRLAASRATALRAFLADPSNG